MARIAAYGLGEQGKEVSEEELERLPETTPEEVKALDKGKKK